MKIQCDVCEMQEASVFCGADEAALCEGCDYRVHHANKLATKHLRFSLLHPSFKDAPLCDICQVKRAFLFCKEDRAILCRECDISIHKSNEHTQNHHRFLLTGVRISSPLTTFSNSNSISTTSSQPNNSTNSNTNISYYSNNSNSSKITSSSSMSYSLVNEDGAVSMSGNNNTIPHEYLMDNMSIPGWSLEDLLDSSYHSTSHYF